MNAGLNVDDQLPDPDPMANDDRPREKYSGTIVGFYKTLGTDMPPPVNVTSCSDNSDDYAFYCDDTELPNMKNSCNPDGGVQNGPIDGVNTSATGTNTHCGFYFGATGSSTGLGC